MQRSAARFGSARAATLVSWRVIGQHEGGAPLHARKDVRVAAAAALIVLLLAFAAGRITAAPGPAEPELRPASAGSARLQLPQLADAAPLPALAAARGEAGAAGEEAPQHPRRREPARARDPGGDRRQWLERVLLVLFVIALGAAPDASACNRWASSSGSDRATGTAAAPFRSVTRLLRAVPNGGTGCLRRGSWFRERVTIRRPVTLRSVGGRANLVGQITIARHVPNVRLSGLAVRGSGPGQAAILVRGDRARIIGNDISGPGYRNRNTPCILLDGPRDVLIEANRIHNCARVSRRNLYAPGILVSSALRTQILHNVVYHTLGDGIALAPNAQRTRVARNIVDGNTSGIYIGGGPRTASSYNVVTRNVISNSGRWNVHSAWSGPTGKGNVVASNCLWNGFGGTTSGGGFRLVGNINASPRFRNRPHDFGMGTGPCLVDAPEDRPDLAIRATRLPGRLPAPRAAGPGADRPPDADRADARNAPLAAVHEPLRHQVDRSGLLLDSRPPGPARRVARTRRDRRGARDPTRLDRASRPRRRHGPAARRQGRPRTNVVIDTGVTIAGYRTERRLGSGGMGTVYEATQLSLGRVVALKVLAPEFGEDAVFRERFRREAMLQAALEHPNIVPVYEAGESPEGCSSR